MTLGGPGGLGISVFVRVKRSLFSVLLGTVFALAPLAAHAENLMDAIAAAYQYNPRLDAERARLRATDEGVSQAMSNYRPNLDLQADTGKTDVQNESQFNPNTAAFSSGTFAPRGYTVQLTQPLFRGFRTTNAVNEAEANVRAGRETLRNVEQEVLVDVVESFVNIVRDQQIVKLREESLRFFVQELQATRDRFAVGEVTRTDVAQAEAERAAAIGQLEVARATLKASRAAYEQVVGASPRKLNAPGLTSKLLPRSLDDAIHISSQENPLVVAALYREQGARFAVDLIRGELLPEARLEASYTERWDPNKTTDKTETATVRGVIDVPIYEGGQVYSRVRAAKHTHLSRIQEIEQNRAQAQALVAQAWAQLAGARAQMESDKAQIEANQVALNGVREEEKVGQRQLSDVLDAQKALVNSQVQLERSKRDVVAFTYAVISGIGRLNVAELGAVGMTYDPDVHYHEVRRKWIGLDISHDDEVRRGEADPWAAKVERAPTK